MINNKPITIIIPTYNRLGYFRDALESALTQTHANIEVIVCDNASTDGTSAFIATHHDKRIKYIRQEKFVDYVTNFNSWMSISTGDFVCYLTDDDKLEPTFIEKCMIALISDENTMLVKTGSFIINEKSEIVSGYLPFKSSTFSGTQFIFDRLNPRYSEFSMLCGYMFRKSDFIKAGCVLSPGDPPSHAADDYLWFRMVLLGGNVKYINEKLWYYRTHSSNYAVVGSLEEFRKFCSSYIHKIITLFEQHADVIDKNILDYVRYEYKNDMIKNRVLNELGRNRKNNLTRAFKFIYSNRKIIREYQGTKRIFYEIALNIILMRRTY